MASTPRDFEKTQVTVLTLISGIFFTRRLLRPNCFQAVGNITLKEVPRWQDLLRWETKSKKTPKPVAFGPRSVVLLKYRNTNEDLTMVLEQLKIMMPMVKDESLVKIHICLFDDDAIDPQHMVEHFTIKLRHQHTGVSTVSVSWAGCGGIVDDGPMPKSIEDFLEKLVPIPGRVYAGIWYQIDEARSEAHQDSGFDLCAADDVLAGKPGYVCVKDCLSMDVLPTTPWALQLAAADPDRSSRSTAKLAQKARPGPAPIDSGLDIPDFPPNFDELAEKRWQ
ncbi:hypothetical protein MAPG_04901 [Magnaporthiopsis poae ATCC 64411]|uniref:Uncharacterized protein n=1 Tax=Magnaporthiopsis poae (strain ATCC 64411 / 73-15) TaxID=644358 RepID=A0A0C4DXZ4_MAGP6|nr:hypothetical protein MAPG_04901 [Magnaporthiopsis poae ATCC 64411]